jgi:hypothetical protein
MSHYNTLLVLDDGNVERVDACIATLRKDDWIEDEAAVPPGAELRQLELKDTLLDDLATGEARLQSLSRAHRLDMVWIRAQSSVEAFAYSHWLSGRTVRSLACGDREDGVWSRAEGEPEQWESEAFEGEEVRRAGGAARPLGQLEEDGPIATPMPGDLSVAADAMKYARCALSYYR